MLKEISSASLKPDLKVPEYQDLSFWISNLYTRYQKKTELQTKTKNILTDLILKTNKRTKH